MKIDSITSLQHIQFRLVLCIVLTLLIVHGSAQPQSTPLRGVSGMTLVDLDNLHPAFLYVYDFKMKPDEKNFMRFGILTTTSESHFSNWNPKPVDSEDWSLLNDVKSNDLEAICRIPGTNSFIAAESSYFRGNYGRLIFVELSQTESTSTIKAYRAIKLPKSIEQIEGLVCLKLNQSDKNELLIIISERDGKTNANTIKWELLDLEDSSIESLGFENSISFDTPFEDELTRDITDLYLDPAGRLLCSASRDMGDFGPFKSAIYLIGQVNAEKCCTIHLYPKPTKMAEIEGLKIEALSSPIIPGSRFTIGTDDEKLGSIFRPIGY